MILQMTAYSLSVWVCVFAFVCVCMCVFFYMLQSILHFTVRTAGPHNFKCPLRLQAWLFVMVRIWIRGWGGHCVHKSPRNDRSINLKAACACERGWRPQSARRLAQLTSKAGERSRRDSVNPMRLISDTTLAAAEAANYKDLIIHPSCLNCCSFFSSLCFFITDKTMVRICDFDTKISNRKRTTAGKH